LLEKEVSFVGSPVWKASSVGLLLLAMSGCAAEVAEDEKAPTTGGGIEMAVSQTCDSGSLPECISVNGEYVMVVPSDFVRAGVEDAVAVANGETSAVDVKFDSGGATVFQTSTAEAAQAGETARLVMKVGDTVLSAVAVPEALQSDSVLVALPPDASADELVDSIRDLR
jgi:hypothetical protein